MWSSWRGVPVVLAVSLLTNIFLIGVITGHVFTAEKARAPRPGQSAIGWVRGSKLPAADKQGFAAVMRSYRETMDTKRAALKSAKAALEAAVAKPVYDRAQVAAAFADVRRASLESQETTQTALVEALGTLSPAARASLLPP